MRELARWRFFARQQRHRRLIGLAIIVSVLVTARLSEVELSALFDGQGWSNAKSVLSGLGNPDFSAEYLELVLRLSLDSILIGVLGTALGAVIAIVLAMSAAKLPGLPDPPGRHDLRYHLATSLRWFSRTLLSFLRSIPDIIWAYLFVRMIGLGPGPAVLALAISLGGIMGKLFYELLESVDPQPLRAMWETGASGFAVLIYGALPQVRKQWLGYALFRLECAIRSASILGIVGAGGLGAEIALSIRYFQYDKLGTCLIVVLAYVIVVELASAYLRSKPIKWSVAIAGTLCIIALVRLDVPWSDLWSGAEMFRYAATFSLDGLDTTFWKHAIYGMAQTIGMAWCATMLAAGVAFLLAPLATRDLTVGTYLADRVSRATFGWLSPIITRVIFQVLRAMPELTLAFIAVLWVGPGAFAGVLAICLHSIGILGRLYGEIYADVERGPVAAIEAGGTSRFGLWLYSIRPQVRTRVISHTLLWFEINIRAAATMGFVGAGGIGDSLHTALSLFHMADLTALLIVMFATIAIIDYICSQVRLRIMQAATHTPTNRRKQERVRILAAAGIEYWPQDKPLVQADIIEVAMGGLLLSGKDVRFLPEGTIVNLRLHAPDTSLVEGVARVTVNRVFENGVYGLGLAFVEVNTQFQEALALTVRRG